MDARAEARGMRSATYVSVLIRSHLRRLAPLPKEELLALKRSIGELASIGRNINQIAKAVNEGGRAPGSVREEFRAMLKICEALRENTKALLKANETSWEAGDVQCGPLGFARSPCSIWFLMAAEVRARRVGTSPRRRSSRYGEPFSERRRRS